MSYLNELDEELKEEFAYEYEDEAVGVDEIIANLKNNISDYIFENPEDMLLNESVEDMDYDFHDVQIPDEVLEKLEPKDKLFDFLHSYKV
ncbi:hypothetical protein [uncultured Methanobrevibacter sp.]|uniref:hypothetical protein n=1 Tax=uncultured Methanobrevibacter sp. TaxID=253161 RepID=UPI0025F8A94E|nr:hypothetical protein [uncultured Methanobrevibacter sp.]